MVAESLATLRRSAEMGTFGTLSRRLPQDPVQTAPYAYPTLRRSPNVDDRREEQLTDLDRARILLGLAAGQNPQYPAANMPPPGATPLGVQAGMLDIQPSHERWLAERIGSQPSWITVSTRSEADRTSTHQKTRPAQRYLDLVDPPGAE